MSLFFFFNDTATTEIYTLSLHDALPISFGGGPLVAGVALEVVRTIADPAFLADVRRKAEWLGAHLARPLGLATRSEEHTSELQSQSNLVCRLLLEKKKIAEARAHLLM